MIAGNPIMAGGKKPSGSVNITANGTFDVTEKASAVVNVVSAPVLLWTNPSPEIYFPGQTVSFSGSYDGYLIETRDTWAGTNVYGISFVNSGATDTSIGASARANGGCTYAWCREVEAVNPNSIVFSGNSWAINRSYQTNGQYARPTRIWGVHFTVV